MKLIHYIDGKLDKKYSDLVMIEEKKSRKYKFFLDNIMNYIYITDRLVFKRESEDYIIELNLSEKPSCKIYLKSENKDLEIVVVSSNYTINERYIDFKYVLDIDSKEHHIILEIGD